MNQIKFGKMNSTVILPSRREEDGCYDIYANFKEDSIKIGKNEVVNVSTGLKSIFNKKYRICIRERGSNTKSKLLVMAGQIDSNYRGEWFISLYNTQDYDIIIDKNIDDYKVIKKDNGEISLLYVPYSKAVAQFAVEEIPQVDIVEVDIKVIEEDITNRYDGKIGSSGK